MSEGAFDEPVAIPAELFAAFAELFERVRKEPRKSLEIWLPEAAAALSERGDSAAWLASAGRIAAIVQDALGKLLLRQDRDAVLSGKLVHAALIVDAARRHFLADPVTLNRLIARLAELWRDVFGHCGFSLEAGGRGGNRPPLPLADPRFADPLWRDALPFALLHQTWLLLEAEAAAAQPDDPLGDRLRRLIAAIDPRGFPLADPAALGRFFETRGASLADWLELRLTR